MSHRFVRCPHCKLPHDAAETVCPATGLRLSDPVRQAPKVNVTSRMTGQPPPPRRPEPLSSFKPPRDAARRPAPLEGARPRKAAPGGSSRAPQPAPAPTPTLHQELLGRTLGGRYLIKGVLGEGGMGTVFDAEHLGLGRHVAVKVLSPTQARKRVAVKRFQQEARAAGAIGHPNICEVYDFGLLEDGNPYLVMEKLVGVTLADRIAKEGGLPFEDVVGIISQVLAGLIAAHEKGIVHRDIKPENIFLARRPAQPTIVKLLDFGVSKMMAEFQTSEDALDLTRTGMVMGTPYYMSPEQARGERNLDGRVDVYACGVVMYEAIAGRRPYLAPNYNALLLAIINTSPKPLSELRPSTPPALEAIIARAMARSRADRFASAREMLSALTPKPERRASRRPRQAETRSPPAAPLRAAIESADSVDIPVHFSTSGSDEIAVDEDDATAVYRPGKHGPFPPSTVRTPRTARAEAARARPAPAPGRAAPLPNLSPKGNEWDGETVVQRPSALPSPPVFNPEQTVRLDGSELEAVRRHRVPPRRR